MTPHYAHCDGNLEKNPFSRRSRPRKQPVDDYSGLVAGRAASVDLTHFLLLVEVSGNGCGCSSERGCHEKLAK
jgi:hypothetical protein